MQLIFEIFRQSIIEMLPQILWAVLIFFAGWFISKWIGKGITSFLEKTKLNQALKRLGLEEALIKIDTRLNAPKFFGEVFRWSAFLFFLMACSEILDFDQLTVLLRTIIGYLPNIFVASLIFIVAVFLTDFFQKIVVGTLEKEKIIYSRFLGKGLSLTIWLLAILAILYQLKIVPNLILTIFIGVMAIIVLTLGIAFGLGGKDLAKKILEELEEKFK